MVKMDGYIDRSTLTPFVRLKLISAMDEEIELSAIIDTGYNAPSWARFFLPIVSLTSISKMDGRK